MCKYQIHNTEKRHSSLDPIYTSLRNDRPREGDALLNSFQNSLLKEDIETVEDWTMKAQSLRIIGNKQNLCFTNSNIHRLEKLLTLTSSLETTSTKLIYHSANHLGSQTYILPYRRFYYLQTGNSFYLKGQCICQFE